MSALPATALSASAAVDTTVNGRPVHFVYPESEGLRPFVEAVLEGRDYPLVHPGIFQPRTIIDIGAHAGAATVYFKAHYPEAEVFAFEPCAATFDYLEQNIASLRGVMAFCAALGAEDAEGLLFTGRHSSMQNSLLPNEENAAHSEPVSVLGARTVFEGLDVESFSIVKLDTEGLELPILRALEPFFPRIEVIHLEYHSEPDRLALDRLLAPHFLLHAARADEPHRGTGTYVRHDVSERCQARLAERYVFPKATTAS